MNKQVMNFKNKNFQRQRISCHNARGRARLINRQTGVMGGISMSLDFFGTFFVKKKSTENTRRGFTGHEHYPELKIINMNARLYDPVIGRFFSPDNYVVENTSTQDFNRYSYCLNSPLKYVDPSGWRYQDVDDIIDFDRNGNYIGRTTANFDQIRVLNKDNTVYAESKTYSKGFFDNIMTFGKASVNIAGKGLQNLEGLSMDFGDNLKGAMAAFRFLAANTTPEWSAFGRNNFNGGMDNILSTTHKPNFEYFGSELARFAAYEGNLIYDFHSHKTTPFPSDRISNKHSSDIGYRQDLLRLSPNATFGILYNNIIRDYKGYTIIGY